MAQPHCPRRKHRRMEAAVAEADALVSLPPDALDAILARLPLRDAVRTAVLSRTWRRRWEALPSLDLSSIPLWAVDSILLRCPGRARRFHVDLDKVPAYSFDDWKLTLSRRLYEWLLIFSRRGLESLALRGRDGQPFIALSSSVYSCVRLTVLDLCMCDIPPIPPGFTGFPNLKNLILSNVELEENAECQLEEIIETSPLLEELVFYDEVGIFSDFPIERVIRAPNLRHLKICSVVDYGWNLEELPSLRCAVLDLWEYTGDHFVKFLAALVQVRKLEFSTLVRPLNGAKILETLSCTFDNLKSLKLHMHFCELPPILSMLRLLMSAPNLEKLKILIHSDEEQKIEAHEEFQSAQGTDDMCRRLQVVKMAGINWFSNEMSFIELILSKARLLRKLFVSHGKKIAMPNEDALSELLKYKRASPEAQVLF